MVMERLTDCAQGYCEMYCKKYMLCFEDPEDCIFKYEIKLYDAVKSIEGIVPFDRLLELADADRAGKLVVLPCKAGDHVWVDGRKAVVENFFGYETERYLHAQFYDNMQYIDIPFTEIGKTVFLTREEAEVALAQEGGTHEDSGGL